MSYSILCYELLSNQELRRIARNESHMSTHMRLEILPLSLVLLLAEPYHSRCSLLSPSQRMILYLHIE